MTHLTAALPLAFLLAFAAGMRSMLLDVDCNIQHHTSPLGSVAFDCGDPVPECDDALPCQLDVNTVYPPEEEEGNPITYYKCKCSNYTPALHCYGIGEIEVDPQQGNLWRVTCVRNGCANPCSQNLPPKVFRQFACRC